MCTCSLSSNSLPYSTRLLRILDLRWASTFKMAITTNLLCKARQDYFCCRIQKHTKHLTRYVTSSMEPFTYAWRSAKMSPRSPHTMHKTNEHGPKMMPNMPTQHPHKNKQDNSKGSIEHTWEIGNQTFHLLPTIS